MIMGKRTNKEDNMPMRKCQKYIIIDTLPNFKFKSMEKA